MYGRLQWITINAYLSFCFSGVKSFIIKAEKKLSDMYGENITIRSLEFDAYTCPNDFELDNIKLHLI